MHGEMLRRSDWRSSTKICNDWRIVSFKLRMKHFELFDAVRIVRLPNGRNKIPAYYSQIGTTEIKLGDIGVVIGDWPGNKYRVEAVNTEGAIDWQDHFEPAHLEVLPVTTARFSRRRINEHWAYQLAKGEELLDKTQRSEALKFAQKVMSFARRNVELLIERLVNSDYQFANTYGPRQAPEEDISSCVEELANQGVHVPVALQAWLMEIGCVDFTGTHPKWPRTAYSGLGNSITAREPWYTDPLFVWFSPQSLLKSLTRLRLRPTRRVVVCGNRKAPVDRRGLLAQPH